MAARTLSSSIDQARRVSAPAESTLTRPALFAISFPLSPDLHIRRWFALWLQGNYSQAQFKLNIGLVEGTYRLLLSGHDRWIQIYAERSGAPRSSCNSEGTDLLQPTYAARSSEDVSVCPLHKATPSQLVKFPCFPNVGKARAQNDSLLTPGSPAGAACWGRVLWSNTHVAAFSGQDEIPSTQKSHLFLGDEGRVGP